MLKYIRSNAIALLALCIAVSSGGAWAAQQIGSSQIKANAIQAKHIAKDAVLAKHIEDEQVTPAALDLVATTRTVGNITPSVIATPITQELKVKASRGDLLTIHARVDISLLADDSLCSVRVELRGPAGDESRTVMRAIGVPKFRRVYLAGGGVEFASGNMSPLGAEPITFLVVEPGTYTFHLVGTGPVGCTYSDRNLAIALAG